MNKFEKKIVIFLNRPRTKALDFFSKLISDIKFLVLCWVAIIAWSMSIDLTLGIDILVRLIAVFALHYLVSELIIKFGAKKLNLKRHRPYVAYPNEIRALGHNFSDSSFPSSHVSSVVGGLVILHSAFPMALPILIIFAMLLALSRLYNGMHYPTDILAGVILGLIYGKIVLMFL